jgi:energy-coupling factor transporter ATP-binding protein EcfA2
MLKYLTLRNFTVFKEAKLAFSPGLNVIIGENGTGKTHLLKLGYLFSNAWHHLVKNQSLIAHQKIERYFSEHTQDIFKPDKLGSLTHTSSDGKSSVSGTLLGGIPTSYFHAPNDPEIIPPISDDITWQFSFSNRSKDNIVLDNVQDRLTTNASYGKGLYLPSKEMISFFEGFLALYEKRETAFDETYRDLALHLSANKLKMPPAFIKQGLKELATDVEGTLKLEGGKFYLVSSGSKSREITLVAEGIRKISTLLHLLENGSLEVGDTLLWDEPESNLNPKLIKDVAAAILFLCKNGIQVVIGTHSLFLLREIEILSGQKHYKDIPQRYFALGKQGDSVTVQQGNQVDDINPFVMLDEELAQSDRFINADNN